MGSFFDTSIEFLKGVGPQRAALLQKELKIFTFGDLVQHYPFRYDDRTKFYEIKDIREEMPFVQIAGRISRFEIVGSHFKKRLVGTFSDSTGTLDLVWFQGINWALQKIKPGVDYVVFGKPNRYGKIFSIAHPEVEPVHEKTLQGGLQSVYSLSEMLRKRHLDSKFISRLQQEILRSGMTHFRETLPDRLLKKYTFPGKKEAVYCVHFPENAETLHATQHRLKFEELFYLQLRLLKLKLVRYEKFQGQAFTDTSILTAVANDFGYDQVFSRQVEALGSAGDILVAISTSGMSKSILLACEQAKQKKMTTIGFTGVRGGDLAKQADLVFASQHEETAHVQEIHMVALHAISEAVEKVFFG